MSRVSYVAWAIDLSSDYDDKTNLVAFREFMFVLGCLCATMLPLAISSFVEDDITQLSVAATMWAAVIFASNTLCCLFLPDGKTISEEHAVAHVATKSSDWMKFLGRMVKCRPAMALYAASVLHSAASSSNALLYPFFVKYVMEERGNLEWILGLYIFIGAVCVPLWTWVAKRLDKKRTLQFGLLIQSGCLLYIFVAVQRNSTALYMVAIITAGIVLGGISVLKYSMLGDVSDLLQAQAGGSRDEGKLVSIFDFSSGMLKSWFTPLNFWFIDLSGYQPDVIPQSSQTVLTIRIVYSLVPSVCAIISFVLIGVAYKLDRQKHLEILAQLEALPTLPQKDESAESGQPSGVIDKGGEDHETSIGRLSI
eukprot:TRINITY_DN55547_c0_g1_i1.p1 TRINITY_DN55547_c0_g1~~TRINITY_DN55547_c0_g1_i1.p1  ORF type:complete len:389 (-),score=25.82 TRINITY_DN55547_c0_g1_i1:281-1378(-)